MQVPFTLILIVFFLSGMTGLIYEVLWLKELGLLFGNAAYALATTLAAFFAGLAAGGYFWGQRATKSRNPLKLYAYLEIGVAVCALGYFVILDGYAWIYPQIYDWFGQQRWTFVGVKFLLAVLILFPAAWFMGGTLPVLSQYQVSQRDQLGSQVSLLYAVNTLGAVLGVYLAGFYLPAYWGFRNSYLFAIAIAMSLGLVVWLLARSQNNKSVDIIVHSASKQQPLPNYLLALAFISGLLMLALQVLWNRMFAQVLQNSVYTFALLLMVFLFCLALGGLLAKWLMATDRDKNMKLFGLLMLGGFLVALTPYCFIYLTDNLHYLVNNQGWTAYLVQIFKVAMIVIGPPVVVLGGLLPMLIKISEQQQGQPGEMVGKLFAVNTLGAISGSLLAGFVILDTLGLWAGIRLLAILYVLSAWLWLDCHARSYRKLLLAPAMLILLMVSLLDTSRLPLLNVDPVVEQESLLEVWEGSSATVAVIRQREELKLKVNNYYTLGGSGSFQWEQLQGYLPLLLHDNPKSVYVLGMGTGITAGGSLLYPISSLKVTELIPEVVKASEKYFGEYNNQLFFDPRVEIIVEDGRNYLRASRGQFDVIISDLFVPWKAGVGSLYTLEHYQTVKNRLKEQGLFMQWLPTYQLTRHEFEIIAKTMLEVFPQVTVWRGDFGVLKPIIGLLGQQSVQPLSAQAWLFSQPAVVDESIPLLTLYVGNLANYKEVSSDTQINRDDLPLIEMLSPVSQLQTKTGQVTWLAGQPLLDLMVQLLKSDEGDYLSNLNDVQKLLPQAGYALHDAQFLKYLGQLSEMETQMQKYSDIVIEK